MHSVTFPLALIPVALSRWSINLYFLPYLIPTTFLPPSLLTFSWLNVIGKCQYHEESYSFNLVFVRFLLFGVAAD